MTFAAFLRRGCRRAIPPGHCHVCGYDLRASKVRCPECGTRFPNRYRSWFRYGPYVVRSVRKTIDDPGGPKAPS